MTNIIDKISWYVANTRHQNEKKIKEQLDLIGIENYVPFQTITKEKDGKRINSSKPLIPRLVFIHTDYQTALSLVNDLGLKMTYLRNHETRKLLIIPDKQMKDFMFLLDFSKEAIQIKNINLKKGQHVRIIKGEFSGIEGELIRIKGHKRVVVRLEGLFSLATTYIPASFLEIINDK